MRLTQTRPVPDIVGALLFLIQELRQLLDGLLKRRQLDAFPPSDEVFAGKNILSDVVGDVKRDSVFVYTSYKSVGARSAGFRLQ